MSEVVQTLQSSVLELEASAMSSLRAVQTAEEEFSAEGDENRTMTTCQTRFRKGLHRLGEK